MPSVRPAADWIASGLFEKAGIFLTKLCCGVIIEEWQKRIAPSTRHHGHSVQHGAGKDHGGAGRRPELARAILREIKLAAIEVIVEIYRHCETAVRCLISKCVMLEKVTCTHR